MSKYKMIFNYDPDPECEPEFKNGLPILRLEGPDCIYSLDEAGTIEKMGSDKETFMKTLQDIGDLAKFEINWDDSSLFDIYGSDLNEQVTDLLKTLLSIRGYQDWNFKD